MTAVANASRQPPAASMIGQIAAAIAKADGARLGACSGNLGELCFRLNVIFVW